MIYGNHNVTAYIVKHKLTMKHQNNTRFAVHLQEVNINLCPYLFHYGQYTLINTKMTFNWGVTNVQEWHLQMC